MATAMESAIAVLVIIAIIISAGTLYYMTDLTARIARIEEQVAPPPLTVVGPWSGAEEEAFLPILEAFTDETGIEVNYRIYRAEDLSPLLPAQFAARTAPGDVIFMWGWYIKQIGPQGHALEATDLIDEADFISGVLDPVKVGDAIYGGAYTGKVKPGFWYRKSFFNTHGLTEPTTWTEFMALLDSIKAISGIVNPIVSGDEVGWPLSDVTEHFIATFGSAGIHRNLTAGTTAWNSSQVRTVFADKLVPLLQGGYFSEPTEWTAAIDSWWAGDYGLYPMGSWITGMVDNATDLGFFPLPGATAFVFVADYFFIPTYTKHPDEAKQLLQFLASTDAQEIQVGEGGHIATNLNVSLNAYPAVDRVVAEFATDIEALADIDDTIGGAFQEELWTQLKLLWVSPESLDDVLDAIETKAP